jgi:hypothetical protein
MERRQWINQGQPQTLVIACFLLYLNAALAVLSLLAAGGGLNIITVAVIVVGVLAAYGIANERRWGYYLALAVAVLPFVLQAAFNSNHNPFGTNPINLIFEVVLVALLLHTQSREYQKVWFK